MFDAEALDAVFVCTPPAAHVESASEALGRGVAVYLEKPLARGEEDGAAIARAWRESGAVCAGGRPATRRPPKRLTRFETVSNAPRGRSGPLHKWTFRPGDRLL